MMMRMELTRVAALTFVTATSLAGTPLVAEWDQAAPETIEVPLRVEAGRLVAPVTTADGETLDFIVSTGNGATVFSESTNAKLGAGAALMLGTAAVDAEHPYPVPDESLVVDGVQFDGIVGANTLNRYDVLLDAPGGRLLLKEVGGRVEWPGVALSSPLRLRVLHGIVIGLDVSVNGQDYGAMLDTGTKLLVNEGAATALGIGDGAPVILEMGGIEFADVAAEKSDIAVFERWDPAGNGFVIVGGTIAFECAMAISWVHREMRTCAR